MELLALVPALALLAVAGSVVGAILGMRRDVERIANVLERAYERGLLGVDDS